MNKKGFTLIELLATIIILGLLFGISYGAVSFLLKRTSSEYYKKQESLIVLAAKDYFADYRSKLPKEISDTTFVTLKELIDNKYIDDVKDLKNIKCGFSGSKVIVQKLDAKNYSYRVVLSCDDYHSRYSDIIFNPNEKVSTEPIVVKIKITDTDDVSSYKYRYIIYKDDVSYKESDYADYNGEFSITLNEVGNYRIKVIAQYKDGSDTITFNKMSSIYSYFMEEDIEDNMVPMRPVITNPNDGKWVNAVYDVSFKTETDSKYIGYWQYSYDNFTWNSYDNSAVNTFKSDVFNTNMNQDFYVRVCSKKGKCSLYSKTNIKIDKVKPTLTGKLLYTDTMKEHKIGTWSKKALYRYLYPKDDFSGVSEVQYNNGSGWKTEKNLSKYKFNEINLKSKYRVIDLAGNYSNVLDMPILIDWTPPAYTAMNIGCGDPWGVGYGGVLTIKFSDAVSGLGLRTARSWDKANPNNPAATGSYNGALTGYDILASGCPVMGFEHKICDMAGNCTSHKDSNVRFSCSKYNCY